MRIAYDYGLHPVTPGRVSLPGTKDTHTEPVIVVRLGGRTEQAVKPDGAVIPGTDYRMKTSDEAVLRDREVRAHERAHLMTLGSAAASGIQLTTQKGPDGESYAVGGSVKVDLSPVPGDPRATLSKAQAVLRAALAPGNPSAADMRVAAEAYRLVRDARENILGSGILV